jgi:hypothetical protein
MLMRTAESTKTMLKIRHELEFYKHNNKLPSLGIEINECSLYILVHFANISRIEGVLLLT